MCTNTKEGRNFHLTPAFPQKLHECKMISDSLLYCSPSLSCNRRQQGYSQHPHRAMGAMRRLAQKAQNIDGRRLPRRKVYCGGYLDAHAFNDAQTPKLLRH
jgi:hypothetical protein